MKNHSPDTPPKVTDSGTKTKFKGRPSNLGRLQGEEKALQLKALILHTEGGHLRLYAYLHAPPLKKAAEWVLCSFNIHISTGYHFPIHQDKTITAACCCCCDK